MAELSPLDYDQVLRYCYDEVQGALRIMVGVSFWREPVADIASLPASGNTTGDVRFVIGTRYLVYWDGTAWQVPFVTFPVFNNTNRPAAATAGRAIYNTDDNTINLDDGTNWRLPDGTIT